MRSKNRIVLLTVIAATAVSLLLAFVAGCGSDSSAAQTGDTDTAIRSFSPDGIAIVNGKEITKSDLTARMNGVAKWEAETNKTAFPNPGTPEYAALEKEMLDQLVWIEVYRLEAEKLGLTVSDAEVNAQMDPIIQASGGEAAFNKAVSAHNSTVELYRDGERDTLLYNKLFQEVTKSVAPGASETETANNKQTFFNKWISDARSKYEIFTKANATQRGEALSNTNTVD